MTIEVFVLLLALAVGGTLTAIASGAGVALPSSRAGLVVSAATAVTWGVLVVSAGEITHYSGGSEITHSYPSVQYLALAGLVLAVLGTLRAAFADMSKLDTRL